MATTELVKDLIDAGKTLTSTMQDAGHKVTSAFWLYDSEVDNWRLHLAMPLVDEQGPAAAYEVVRAAVQSAQVPSLYLRQIAIESPKDELPAALRKVVSTGPGIKDVRVTNCIVGNVLIEDAHIYRST